MSRDDAARIANQSLREFIQSMAARGNPGSGRHEIGVHHVPGWIFEYDPTVGGSEIQAVIGVDGFIHALQQPRSLRTHKWSASDWVLRDVDDPDPGARASEFADHLSRILAFDRVEGGDSGDTSPSWDPPLGDGGDQPATENRSRP
jgi:hypothetical protein